MAASGDDPRDVARRALAWRADVRQAARSAAGRAPDEVGRALDAAGWGELFADAGPLAALFAAKRGASRALLIAVRRALDGVPGPRRLLEPQAFPPPFHRISGFPLGGLAGIADRIGIKLYTMHWPMIARYWARDLAGDADPAALDALTAAIAQRFEFTDGLVDGARLRYPEPHEAHPVGANAQRTKLRTAQASSSGVPITAFVHSYGPLADVVARYALAADAGTALWINRYGYLSDAKIAALAAQRHASAAPAGGRAIA